MLVRGVFLAPMRVLLLSVVAAALVPSNIMVTPSFEIARRELAGSLAGDGAVNTIVVERAAGVRLAWGRVAAPASLSVALPDAAGDEAGAAALARAEAARALRGLPDADAAALAARVAALCAEFARCCPAPGTAAGGGAGAAPVVRAKLLVADAFDARDAARCPRVHVDWVDVRLIATLEGRGTQVLDDAAIDRDALHRDDGEDGEDGDEGEGEGGGGAELGAAVFEDDVAHRRRVLVDLDAEAFDAPAGDVVFLVGAASARARAARPRTARRPRPRRGTRSRARARASGASCSSSTRRSRSRRARTRAATTTRREMRAS